MATSILEPRLLRYRLLVENGVTIDVQKVQRDRETELGLHSYSPWSLDFLQRISITRIRRTAGWLTISDAAHVLGVSVSYLWTKHQSYLMPDPDMCTPREPLWRVETLFRWHPNRDHDARWRDCGLDPDTASTEPFPECQVTPGPDRMPAYSRLGGVLTNRVVGMSWRNPSDTTTRQNSGLLTSSLVRAA